MTRSNRLIRVTAILLLTLVACGTRVDKEAFYAALRSNPGAAGEAATPRGAQPTDGPALAPRGESGRASGPASGAAAPRGGSSSAPANLHLSTAEVGKVINIGLHVPQTGAAPLPTNWQDSLDVVTSSINAHPINGRTVRFTVEDDGYDPAKGLAACRKLADENVLFVIGHTMPTIEDSCAGFFNSRHIPYLMRGIPESALKNRPIAYFGTASDDLQARLLAKYVLKRLGGTTKNSAVVTENDQPVSKEVFSATIKAGGGKIVATENSTPRQSDFSAIITKLQNADAAIVFLNIAPVDAIKIAVQSQSVGYHPTWVGEGTHWNYNLSMESAGQALDGAVVFSPWPSVDSAAANQYKAAFAQYKPGATPDDIGLIIWGWAMLARQAISDAGPHLSRASLVAALNTLSFNQPYWQPINYSATDHRGATQVAVFRGDGQAKRWRQIEGFRSSF